MCQAGPTYISNICELGHKYPVWQLERVAMTSAEREVDLFGGHYEVPPSDKDYNDEHDEGALGLIRCWVFVLVRANLHI